MSFCSSHLIDNALYTRCAAVCYDVDNNRSLDHQDLIGEATCTLADIITARGQKLIKQLRHPHRPSSRRGQIVIESEEVAELNYKAVFQFSASKLDKKDLFGKSDPFFVISRAREGSTYVPVYKSEEIKKTLDPVWRQFSIPVQRLCNGDLDRPLLFEVFDWNRSGKHELIGQFKTSLRELTSGTKKEFEVIDPAKKRKKKGKYINSGVVKLIFCEMKKTYSFIEYLAGGCQISLIVAIDFTASNGNPNYSNSLHYNNPQQPNEYVKAITAVGEILSHYDSDQMFPVYGFGAKIPPGGQVSHCFPLNGNYSDPEVPGIQGILNVYQNALNSVTLYGPTIFAQVLRAAFQIASSGNSQENQQYYILLILTDGVINDMDATIDEIVKNNHLPLSIIIVGVGDADFTNMEILDADDNPLRSSNGQVAKRDIVQFVPFREFKNAPASRLAKATLEEIPGQLLSYMEANDIKPNPPRQFDPSLVPMSGPIPSSQGGYMSQKGGTSAMMPQQGTPSTASTSSTQTITHVTQVQQTPVPQQTPAPYGSGGFAVPPAPYGSGGYVPTQLPPQQQPQQSQYVTPYGGGGSQYPPTGQQGGAPSPYQQQWGTSGQPQFYPGPQGQWNGGAGYATGAYSQVPPSQQAAGGGPPSSASSGGGGSFYPPQSSQSQITSGGAGGGGYYAPPTGGYYAPPAGHYPPPQQAYPTQQWGGGYPTQGQPQYPSQAPPAHGQVQQQYHHHQH
ncbi:Copine-4 [Balamuthia mandrillaris]